MSLHRAERRFPRSPAKHTALVKTIDAGVEGFACTSNVSVGGCSILTREPVRAGVAVELMVTIDSRVIQVFGRTVYSREVEPGRVEVGVEFLDVIEEDAVLLESLLIT